MARFERGEGVPGRRHKLAVVRCESDGAALGTVYLTAGGKVTEMCLPIGRLKGDPQIERHIKETTRRHAWSLLRDRPGFDQAFCPQCRGFGPFDWAGLEDSVSPRRPKPLIIPVRVDPHLFS